MADNRTLNQDSPAVRTHIEIMQGVIQRMAENSRSCKVWCVTLVSAVLVLAARSGEPQHALIALVPSVLFFVLDAYYLALERGFRKSYDDFVSKVHSRQISTSDLYIVAPSGSKMREFLWAMLKSLMSFSVLPFYIAVIATILLAWRMFL